MEDLLRALRNIGLALPDPEQLLQLSDPDPEVQSNLAQLIALNPSTHEYQDEPRDEHDAGAADGDGGSDDGDAPAMDPLMDADLFRGAVQALLENYNKFIDKERDALQREHAALASPKKIKPVPFRALMARQDAEIKRRAEEVHAAGCDPDTGRKRRRFYLPRQTFDGYGSYASDKPLVDLSRLDADDFAAPKRFEGRYLLCRVASRLNLYVSCTFIATLPSGHAIPVSISHFTPNLHLSGADLDAHLPIGTVLAIREPYISQNHFGKGGPALGGKNVPGVRVDTPSDVLIVDGLGQHDEHLLQGVEWQALQVEAAPADHLATIEDIWKQSPCAANTKGCRWLQDGPLSRFAARRLKAHQEQREGSTSHQKLETALEALDEAERRALAQRTRQLAESLLQHNRPGAALREVAAARLLRVLGQDPKFDGRDLELEGRILHHLGDYERANAAFEAALKLAAAAGEDAASAGERVYPHLVAARAAQQSAAEGPSHENVWSYYFDSSSYPTPRFDQGDWLGAVAVQDIPGAGRGLVLTRDVEEGELLLSCKAAASSYAIDSGCKGIYLLRYTVETGVTSTTTQVLAATKSIHAMLDRPERALPIMGLTAGPGVPDSRWVSQPYPVPPKRSSGKPSADSIALAMSGIEGGIAALSLNGGGGGGGAVSPRVEHYRAVLLAGLDRPSIDSSYVDGVLRFNAFGPAPNPGTAESDSGGALDASELSRSTMVHPLPAILNHACLPNVSSVFFGDVVTTRALHPLKAGTEIMHQYVRGEQPWPLRRSQLSKHGFVCRCGICLLDERDGDEACRTRQKLVGGSFPMLLERSRILLKDDGAKGQSEAERQDDHRDLASSLEDLVDQVQATYHAERGQLRPDLMAIWQKIAQHRAKFDVEAAKDDERNALASIGAVLALHPAATAGMGPDLKAASMLSRLPDLHFDGAIKSMLALSSLCLAQDEGIAKRWAQSALWAHECTIGGGPDVFLDRWEAGYAGLPVRKWIK
ncbi:uncharacterized protein PSFLO_05010 [Pseudozyma flocculosa]|uniref:SET domain-containing protein n=1 Tax=Pseudozyma flocculosa TaxID=84751 RepID=A0A5C3F7Z1_9BASI|nr:uncharacterized protein PSFLO_05010 [Pseudozyma flocculosa]